MLPSTLAFTWSFSSWSLGKVDDYSFGTRQKRKLFPHYHPPTWLGNSFLPVRGSPHTGPGCYTAADVSIHLPSVPCGRIHKCSDRKITLCVPSLSGCQHEKEPWSTTSCRANVWRPIVHPFPSPPNASCVLMQSLLHLYFQHPFELMSVSSCLVQPSGCLFHKHKFSCYRALKMEVTGIHRKSMYSSIQPDFFVKSLVLFV